MRKPMNRMLGLQLACVATFIITSLNAQAQPFNDSCTSTGTGNECLLAAATGLQAAAFAISASNNVGTTIYAASTGSSGTGIEGSGPTYGVSGTSSSETGVYGSSTGSSGSPNGVIGIYGSPTINSSYSKSGVYGASDTNAGVVGTASANYASGVYGNSSGSNSYGVYGITSGSGSSYAVYSDGNFFVNGTQYCSSTTVFTVPSDIRFKNNVQPLTGALDRLLQLRGVTFEWKDPAAHGNRTGPQRGFIAQEVEKVIPEWVSTDEKGFKAVNLTGMEPMVVESLRTLKAEND